MKLKCYFFLASKNFLHKKINILYSILLIIIILLITIVCSFSSSFLQFLNKSSNGNIAYRSLVVNNFEVNIEEIKKIDGISYIAKNNQYNSDLETEENEIIYLYGIPKNFLHIIKGNNLDKYKSNDNVLICPSKFYFGENPEEYNNEFLKHLYNGKDYLNKKIAFKVGKNIEEFEIVGLFNENEYTYGEYNICFTSFDKITDINKKQEEKILEECSTCDTSERTHVYIVVDNSKIKERVIQELKSKGYNVQDMVSIDNNTISFITTIFLGIVAVIIVIVFLIIMLLNNKFMEYNKKNNLIYKAMGYDLEKLFKINYIESTILAITSFVISLLLIGAIYLILNNLLKAEIQTGMAINIPLYSLIVGFVICLFISLLATYFSIKNKNNSIMEELGDNEI